MLSGGGFCDGAITRTEKSYRVWCVLRRGLHEAILHATRQRVQLPACELAASKPAMPITRKNEKAWQLVAQ